MVEIVFPRRIYIIYVVESESWRKEFILFLMQGRTVFLQIYFLIVKLQKTKRMI